jgi:hypothetical protein
MEKIKVCSLGVGDFEENYKVCRKLTSSEEVKEHEDMEREI